LLLLMFATRKVSMNPGYFGVVDLLGPVRK